MIGDWFVVVLRKNPKVIKIALTFLLLLTEFNLRRGVQNPIKYLRWSFLREKLIAETIFEKSAILNIWQGPGYASYSSFQKQQSEVFYIKAVLKKLTIFTEKPLCWSLFWIRLTPAQVFSWEYCEIFKNTYFEEHLLRLLPSFQGFMDTSSTNSSRVMISFMFRS